MMMLPTCRSAPALSLALLTLLAATSGAVEPVDASSGPWIQLFNGRDLTGWTPKIVGYELGDNYAHTFRVQDGLLRVSYDDYEGPFADRFGHLFYRQEFSHYLLRVEYRFVGSQYQGGPEWGRLNSGIMIHGQSPETMGKDQFFPVSIEAQLLGSAGDHRPHTANVCSPGTHVVIDGRRAATHCIDSSSQSYDVGRWVTVELEVHGNRLLRHKVDGQTVLEYSQPQLDDTDPDARRLLQNGSPRMLSGGTISLQSESHPIEFRKVELKVLEE